MRIGKRMKRALDFLGRPYQIKKIDKERCVYRDLGNGFDVEISGIRRPPAGTVCAFICVWRRRPGLKSIEYVRHPRTLDELKDVLDELVEKYSVANPPTDEVDRDLI